MVSFLSVLYRVDEFLKGNIMTRSVFAELLKHNPEPERIASDYITLMNVRAAVLKIWFRKLTGCKYSSDGCS